jgi:murein DD-endopeptidase MepM/ murein hydrolase activator NlpD
MASVASYGKALGALAKDAAVGSIKGIGGAMKGAAFAEMPGIVGAYGFAKNLRADAKKIQNASSGSNASQDNSTATSNVISLEMVRQLKNINANIALQTTLAKGQVDLAAKTAQFSEEAEREKSLRDDALLNAIKDLKGKGLFGGKAANDESGGGGFLSSLASNTLGSIVGNAIGPLLTSFSRSFFSLLTRGLLLLFSPGGLIFTAIAAGLYFAYKAYKNPEEAKKRSAEVLTKKLAAEAGKPGSLSKSVLSQDEAKALLEDADSRMKTAKTPQQRQMAERDINAFGGRARVSAIATGQSTAPSSTSGGSSPGPAQQQEYNAQWRVPLKQSFRVTSEFGDTKGRKEPHKGIDLAVPIGSAVVAASSGIVEKVSNDSRSGNYLIVRHAQGFSTLYCHLKSVEVSEGTKVEIGDFIAKSGYAGEYSTGPHLHFEIRQRDIAIDPRTKIDFGKSANTYKGKDVTPIGDHSTAASLIPKGTAGVPMSETASNKAVAGVKSPLSLKGHWEGGEWIVDDTTKGNASGTLVRNVKAPSDKAVPVYDAAANKKLASINNATLRTTSSLRSGTLKAAQYIWKADNQILQDANKKFVVDFSKATNRALTTSLKQALFPKGVGVSQASTMGQMYRGQQLGNILKIDSRVNKLFTDVLGKQYGPMFAPVFSNMAKSYLEVGARAAGRAIFGGFGGMDANGSNILTGQILGNYAAGKKTLAFEQLVYGATGQATGAETVFAKAGFQNPMQGIQYMADSITAAISDPLNSFMGDPNAKPATVFDPRLNNGRGGYVVAGADVYGGVQRDAFGRPMGGTAGAGLDTGGSYRGSSGQFNPNGPYGQYETGAMQGQNAGNALGQGIRVGPNGQLFIAGVGVAEGQPNFVGPPSALAPGGINNPFGGVVKTQYTPEQIKLNDAQEEKNRQLQLDLRKDAEVDAQKQFDIADAQKVITEQNNTITSTGTTEIVTAIGTLRGLGSGSGTNIANAGGGSFFDTMFGKGTNMAQVGNIGLDLGKSFLTQKVVSALGIKNPYMAILASAAISRGISFAAGKAFDAFAGTETGAAIVTGAKEMLPAWLGGTPVVGESVSGAFGATTATATAVPAVAPAVVTEIAAETAVAETAAATAAETAVGSTMMESLAVAAPYIAAAVFAVYVVSQVYGGGGGSSYTPQPEVVRIMRVKGNNDIGAKTFQRAPKDNPPEQWTTAADQLLNVGFNATKSAEVETKQISPYNFIAVSIVSDDVKFHLIVEDSPSSATEDLSLGAPGKDFAPGAAASKITKFIGEKFKAAYADKTASIEKAILALNKMTYAQVSSDLISTLKTGANKIDTSITAGVFGSAEQDKMMSDYTAHKLQMEGTTQDGDNYNSTPRMVWSQKEGKYVEAPSTMVDGVKTYTPNVLMLDKNGNPIMDTNANGTLDMAEIPTTVNSSASSGSLTVTAGGSTTTTSGAGGSTVVANSGNTTDNSVKQVTTIIQGAPHGDLLRTSTAQTKV